MTLTITDAGADTDTESRGVSIAPSTTGNVIATVSPLSAAIPATFTLDASGSVEAEGETFDDAATQWTVYRSITDSPFFTSAVATITYGITQDVIIDQPGEYWAEALLFYENQSVRYISGNTGEFVAYIDPIVTFESQDGKIVTYGSI